MNPQIAVLGAVFAWLLLTVTATWAQGRERPNVLFILSDDHAAHALSCYGSRLNTTPQLDRLAREGVKFANCFVTNSICTPSRAAILTGRYSHKNGVSVFNRFDGSQATFPKLLQAAGYQTALVGKWHLFSDPTGFDYWNVLPGQGDYHDPVLIENGVRKKYQGYCTDVITDLTLDVLKRRDRNKPFCVLYHHKAPHRDWSPDPKHAKLFADRDLPLPENFWDDYQTRSPAAAEATMRIARDLTARDLKGPPPAGLSEKELAVWKYQRYIKDYLRCIASMDENIGRVLDYLDQEGLAKNTIVIYTSDQGFFLGEHGWFDKRFMYEECLRMPLLVRYPPLVKPGSTCQPMMLNVDFAPTLLELCGVPVPAEVQGKSAVPLLRGETPAGWRTSMYYRYYHYPGDHQVQPHYGVRTTRHKLIYFHLLKAWELYDLERDPREMKNVYGDPAYAPVTAELKTELTRLRTELGDDDSHRPPGEDVPQPPADPKKVGLSLAARYDLSRIAGGKIPDLSPQGNDAVLAAGIDAGTLVVGGRTGKALKLPGKAAVLTVESTPRLNPANKPLSVGGWIRPDKETGVVAAQGGVTHGWSLYLNKGRLGFAVRRRGELRTALGPEVKLDAWTHVAAVVDAEGRVTFPQAGAAGKPGDKPPTVGLVAAQPADGLSLGADTGSLVAESPREPYTGLVEDFRLYWGVIDGPTLKEWQK